MAKKTLVLPDGVVSYYKISYISLMEVVPNWFSKTILKRQRYYKLEICLDNIFEGYSNIISRFDSFSEAMKYLSFGVDSCEELRAFYDKHRIIKEENWRNENNE